MAVILFGVFIALLLLGVPVAFAICSAAATTMFAGFGDAKMMIVVQRMFASCDSFSLIAVPFFIFAATCSRAAESPRCSSSSASPCWA